jgi:uncharacterized protein with HEPN domain
MYIEDIQFSMERIAEYTENYTLSLFRNDQKTVDAVIRNFEIIGEAAKNISTEIKQKYANIPWDEMYALRNKITHEYFGVDFEIIWEIATNHLPLNKIEIDKLLEDKTII